MDIDVGYGLWARVEPELDLRLSRVITQLSERHGGPAFPPHLTLASHFPDAHGAHEAATAAASTLRDIRVRFASVEATSDFYRALYLRAADHAGLSACHAELARRSGAPSGDFLPHLSLFYGDLGAERQRAVADARALLPLGAALTRIEVWRLRGTADAWQWCSAVELSSASVKTG